MRKRTQVLFSGRVQGVGFRYSVREVACGFDATGWVRNLMDGRVELVAEGEEDELQAFLEAIRQSQLGSHIRGEETNWGPATGNSWDLRFGSEPASRGGIAARPVRWFLRGRRGPTGT